MLIAKTVTGRESECGIGELLLPVGASKLPMASTANVESCNLSSPKSRELASDLEMQRPKRC